MGKEISAFIHAGYQEPELSICLKLLRQCKKICEGSILRNWKTVPLTQKKTTQALLMWNLLEFPCYITKKKKVKRAYADCSPWDSYNNLNSWGTGVEKGNHAEKGWGGWGASTFVKKIRGLRQALTITERFSLSILKLYIPFCPTEMSRETLEQKHLQNLTI